MNERDERDCIQKQCLKLGQYLAYVRMAPMTMKIADYKTKEHFTDEEKIHFNRRALQLAQALTFSEFISTILEYSLRLVREPEKAEEIGEEEVEQLHIFLAEFTGLLEEELKWCK